MRHALKSFSPAPAAIASFAALAGSVACGDDAASPKNVTAAFAGVKAGQVRDDNGLGMKLAWCPPLEFTMGSPASETGRGDDENQVHVTLTNGFWMGQHEVTQGQWHRVMRSVPWKAMKAALSSGLDFVKEGDAYPATGVNWQDAMKFCEKLTQQDRRTGRLSAGWQYTLPTEAQWESACLAGPKPGIHSATTNRSLTITPGGVSSSAMRTRSARNTHTPSARRKRIHWAYAICTGTSTSGASIGT